MARRLHRSANHRSAKFGIVDGRLTPAGVLLVGYTVNIGLTVEAVTNDPWFTPWTLFTLTPSATMEEAGMKGTLIGVAVLFVCAAAFAFGDIMAAKSAENDISSALGGTLRTDYHISACSSLIPGNSQVAPASAALATASLGQTVTLTEGSRFPVTGRLTSASATGLLTRTVLLQHGQSQLILVSPLGTSLKNMPVDGTVVASGNPLGYSCSLVLKNTTP